MRGKSGQDLGKWKVSVLGDRTEVRCSGRGAGFGNVESGAPLKHPDGIMNFGEKKAGVTNAALGLSG